MNLCQLLFGLQIMSHISLNVGYSPEDCTDAETCSDCMRAHFSCKWCKDEEYTAARCQSNSTVLQLKLPDCEEWTYPVSDTNNTVHDFSNTTQVKPSRIEITYLRPGEEKEIAITVKSSKGFPLDVYYLMDFSASMKNDLDQLKTLSDSVVESLTDVSSSYGIGFGTFVDKPTFPFANSEPGRIEMPCTGNDKDNCQAVHSFNHEMDITACKEDEDSCEAKADFTDRLNRVNISSNIDAPEGGFDAIVQVAVCSKIGWRTVARRVLFFATDAVFHMAGDGRLAGIIRPNSAECGMDEENTYNRSLTEDYPSIGQLNKVLTDQQIIPIFAVTESVKNDYQKLSDSLTQLSSVGTLSDDSKDVVNLIKEKLEDIVEKTQLNPRTPPGVSVTVTPQCTGEQTTTPNGCFNVKMEEEVNFSIVVKVDQCNAEGNNTYNFDIEIPGISKIPVSLSVTCTCPCEDHVTRNAATCLESGDLVCGACQCYGEVTDGSCVDDGGDVCGGEEYGRCVCGTCDCYHQRYGDYCECSNSTCPRNSEGTLCSGNGDCSCNLCQCDVANGSVLFTGEDCGCRVSKEECKQDLLECSGPSNGECVCGECQCKPGHTGKYCHICQECGPLDCSLYVDCVKCVHDGGSENCECPGGAELSAGPTINTALLQGRHKQCPPIPDELDETCYINFMIEYTDYGAAKQRTLDRILIDRQLDCPIPPNMVAIVAGGVGGILTVGVLLLVLWKVYTSLVDKREYNKFLDERSSAKWNSVISPVYKNPTTNYANPLYTATIEE